MSNLNSQALKIIKEDINKYWINSICDFLYIHKWTFNRWLKTEKIPKNYYFDIFQKAGIELKRENYREKDQFFTKPEKALELYNFSLNFIKEKLKINTNDYYFLEPSAWNWSFYNYFPENNRIGYDLYPIDNEIVKWNFLLLNSQDIPKNFQNKRSIIIGNPPFGLRWNLALRFLNKANDFADIVCFILPQLFESDGKWNPKDRVKWYNLVYSEKLPSNIFIYPNWKEVNISTIFQIWSKVWLENIKKIANDNFPLEDKIKIFSLSNGKNPSQQRNVKMISKCDFYLPSTCFSWMKLYDNFYDLPHHRGYWIKIYQDKEKIIKILKKTDWEKESFLSTNWAKNLRKSIIENIIKKYYK